MLVARTVISYEALRFKQKIPNRIWKYFIYEEVGIPIATGLIGEAELPSVINGKMITHESSTLSLAKPLRLKFSSVWTPACVKKWWWAGLAIPVGFCDLSGPYSSSSANVSTPHVSRPTPTTFLLERYLTKL